MPIGHASRLKSECASLAALAGLLPVLRASSVARCDCSEPFSNGCHPLCRPPGAPWYVHAPERLLPVPIAQRPHRHWCGVGGLGCPSLHAFVAYQLISCVCRVPPPAAWRATPVRAQCGAASATTAWAPPAQSAGVHSCAGASAPQAQGRLKYRYRPQYTHDGSDGLADKVRRHMHAVMAARLASAHFDNWCTHSPCLRPGKCCSPTRTTVRVCCT